VTVRTVTVPCLVGTVVEVSTKDKKKKEEDKSLILGQCCVDLLPILTGEKEGDKVCFAPAWTLNRSLQCSSATGLEFKAGLEFKMLKKSSNCF